MMGQPAENLHRIERTIRTIKRRPIFLILAAAATLVVTLGTFTNALSDIIAFSRTYIVPSSENSRASTAALEDSQYHSVLTKKIEELGLIERAWRTRFNDVESLAQQVAVIADELRPESAGAIRQSLNSPLASEVARVTRRELETMLALLKIKEHANPSSTQ